MNPIECEGVKSYHWEGEGRKPICSRALNTHQVIGSSQETENKEKASIKNKETKKNNTTKVNQENGQNK